MRQVEFQCDKCGSRAVKDEEKGITELPDEWKWIEMRLSVVGTNSDFCIRQFEVCDKCFGELYKHAGSLALPDADTEENQP